MKILVGLGNPGPEYAGTRHNLGFDVVDLLADGAGGAFKGSKFKADTCQFEGAHGKVLLVKPMTFMNLSGEAVSRVLGFYKEPPGALLAIYDDLDFPLGRVKFADSGSSGGHNGVASIIESLGSKNFHRLRLGIGKAARSTVNHVLSGFSPEEKPIAQAVRKLAVEAVGYYLEHGILKAMNRYNATNLAPATSNAGA